MMNNSNDPIKTLELLVLSHEEQDRRNNLTSSGQEYLKGLKSALKILKESASTFFTLEDVVDAVQYGFDYSLNSQHDGKSVPIGNTLQWLMFKKDLSEVPKDFKEIKEKYPMQIPIEDLKFIDEHHQKMQQIFSKIDEKLLKKKKIENMSVIGERSMSPVLVIIYEDGSEIYVKGYDEILKKVDELTCM